MGNHWGEKLFSSTKKTVAKIFFSFFWCPSSYCLSMERENLSQQEINKIKCRLFPNRSPFSKVGQEGNGTFSWVCRLICVCLSFHKIQWTEIYYSWELPHRGMGGCLVCYGTSSLFTCESAHSSVSLLHLSCSLPSFLLSFLPFPPFMKVKWPSIQILSKQRSNFPCLILKRKETVGSLPLLRVFSRKPKRYNLLISTARSRPHDYCNCTHSWD